MTLPTRIVFKNVNARDSGLEFMAPKIISDKYSRITEERGTSGLEKMHEEMMDRQTFRILTVVFV